MKLNPAALEKRSPELAREAIEHGSLVNGVVEIDEAEWAKLKAVVPVDSPGGWPEWAVQIAKFKSGEDSGVGDTIHRMLGSAGVLFEVTMAALGVPCRCPERRVELNSRFPYI